MRYKPTTILRTLVTKLVERKSDTRNRSRTRCKSNLKVFIRKSSIAISEERTSESYWLRRVLARVRVEAGLKLGSNLNL